MIGVRMLAALLACSLQPVWAQSGKQVKVVFEFRRSTTQNEAAVDASGRVVITDRGGTRSSGRVAVDNTQRRTQTSTGIFTLVQDGGESMLRHEPGPVSADRVLPRLPDRSWTHRNGRPVHGRRHLAEGRGDDPGRQPGEGPLDADRQLVLGGQVGSDRRVEASTKLVVQSGRPVVLGGATTQTHEITRRILGYRAGESGTETMMALTATIR